MLGGRGERQQLLHPGSGSKSMTMLISAIALLLEFEEGRAEGAQRIAHASKLRARHC